MCYIDFMNKGPRFTQILCPLEDNSHNWNFRVKRISTKKLHDSPYVDFWNFYTNKSSPHFTQIYRDHLEWIPINRIHIKRGPPVHANCTAITSITKTCYSFSFHFWKIKKMKLIFCLLFLENVLWENVSLSL